jgi:hypothetical protein
VVEFEKGVCEKEVVPESVKYVAKMMLERRFRNSWPKVQEDGKAVPNSRRWTAELPEYGCSLPNSRSTWSRGSSDVRERKKEMATRGLARSR